MISHDLRLLISFIFRLPESNIAPFLTSLQERLKPEGIQVGSYPTVGRGVTVSLIGRDKTRLDAIGDEVASEIQGVVLKPEKAQL